MTLLYDLIFLGAFTGLIWQFAMLPFAPLEKDERKNYVTRLLALLFLMAVLFTIRMVWR